MRVRVIGVLLAGALCALPALAHAQTAAAPAGDIVRLDAEAARLRNDLERVNVEITTLKRGDRNVGADYRLRQRMAEAEELARKLTEAERRLAQLRGGTPPAPAAPVLVTPTPAPGDGPVELEAKADILQDQARRLAEQADALVRSAGQIRSRQLLRRRAGQLERDPFAALDGSKRTMVFKAPAAQTGTGASNKTAGGGMEGPATPLRGGAAMDSNTPPSGAGAAGSSGPPAPTVAPGSMAPGAAAPAPPAPNTPPNTGMSSGNPTAVAPPPATPTFSPQLRTLLDPDTLTAIQKLERAGRPLGDAEALEQAAAALRKRAQTLDGQARAMRAKAR